MVTRVGALVHEGTERLRASESESPRLDAELLLGHVLGVERTSLLAYPEALVGDGQVGIYRVLVDRVWPRGVSKEDAQLDEWCKQIAPSTELRKWFGHDPERWDEFRSRYRGELEDRDDLVDALVERTTDGRVTLVFGAKDTDHNQAVVLAELIDERRRSAG